MVDQAKLDLQKQNDAAAATKSLAAAEAWRAGRVAYWSARNIRDTYLSRLVFDAAQWEAARAWAERHVELVVSLRAQASAGVPFSASSEVAAGLEAELDAWVAKNPPPTPYAWSIFYELRAELVGS